MTDDPRNRPLGPDELRWTCDADVFAPHRDAEDGGARLIGQQRAVDAMRMGLALASSGYNIFVCGPSGTGKMSTVRTLLAENPQRASPLRDYIYVHNFLDPDRPRLLTLPAGESRSFRRAYEGFVDSLTEVIPRILESEEVDQLRRQLYDQMAVMERDLIGSLESRCDDAGFELARVEVEEIQHFDVFPVHRKKAVPMEELAQRVHAGRARVKDFDGLVERHELLKEDLRDVLSMLRKSARRTQESVFELESDAVHEALSEHLVELNEAFPYEGVEAWLSEVADATTDDLDIFREDGEDAGDRGARWEELGRRLRLNVVLDTHGHSPTPVVFENYPSFTNLLGTIERPSEDAHGGGVDFSHIRAGSLLRANGGFLVLDANDAFGEPGAWKGLIRVLKTGELEIQSPEQFLSPGSPTALKPEPIPVDVKVIVTGDEELYRALYLASDDFRRVFKVKAEFDDVMPLSPTNLGLYAHLLWRVEREEQLVPVSDPALARLAEHAVRLADRSDRLSTQFADVTDLQREASYFAREEGADTIGPQHVERASAERRRRHGLTEEKLHELIHDGVVHISTDGEVVGSVNALTVLNLADHGFGQPCRVTATCAPGYDGVISIEREVELSGRIHDKGMMVMSAWLRARYVPESPIALSATLSFEQLHDEIDGDSASVAEAVALLSALSEVPVLQSVAVTGAIDQRGRVLAVGGINEKVEGFFRICRMRGLTGSQGVVIPADNFRSLMLHEDVIEAVRAELFHIWAVSDLDAAVGRLTGAKAGGRDKRGRFPKSSFNGRVQARLSRMLDLAGPGPDPRVGRPRRGDGSNARAGARRRGNR